MTNHVVEVVLRNGNRVFKNVPVGYELLLGGVEIKEGDIIAFAYPHSKDMIKDPNFSDAFQFWAQGQEGVFVSPSDEYRLIRKKEEKDCPCGHHKVSLNGDIYQEHQKFLRVNELETSEAIKPEPKKEILVLVDDMYEV